MEIKKHDDLWEEVIGSTGTKRRDKIDAKVAKQLLNERIGSKIHEKRKALGLTQDQLAEMVGVGRAAISKIENGTKDFQMSTIAQVVWALGLDIDLV